jgi:hypothetical protein
MRAWSDDQVEEALEQGCRRANKVAQAELERFKEYIGFV